MEEIQLIIIVTGLALFITNAMDVLEVDGAKTVWRALVSVIIIGIGVFGPDLILKTLNSNPQSTVAEQKTEKEKELSGKEKLKKLNAYRRSNQRDIFLVDEATANQYLNYLKFKNLDEVALKY